MRRRLAQRKSLAADERGAAIIEMALVVPVLLALGLGIFEFGNLFYSYHLITNGVRDGARYAAGLPGDVVCSETANATQTAIKNIAMKGSLDDGAPWRVSYWDDLTETTVACVAYDNADFALRGGETIYAVTVTAEVPYTALGFLGYFNLDSITLSTAHEERVYNVR